MAIKLTPIENAEEHGPDFQFDCPGCKCCHGVWTKKRDNYPHWKFNGDLENPTLSPSVLVRFGPNGSNVCHSFIKNGMIEFLSDCTHDLKGKTVPLPDVE
jgi:hypothetical protein